MSNKLLADEEVAILRENPYVQSVSNRSVVFTPEFKQIAYDALRSGIKMREILLRNGIDPDTIGVNRVRGFQEKLEKQAKRPEGFVDLKKSDNRTRNEDGNASTQKQIKQLQHELAYTRQEVEFLKKIRMADLEAQKQWESKHRPK